uniref:Wsv119-like protein n=1 Tax=Metopaulias depressus WSSV-like virus TaxID=1675544 RepID=A0A0K0VL23_9VIRU|nr:wsv119-like protein [Metopaulias depressus WSSV-like virus]
MEEYALFIKTVTKLINKRIGKEEQRMVTADDVEKTFAFKKMDPYTLLSLSKNLALETRNFVNSQLHLLDDETDSIKKMVELGLISFVWRGESEENDDGNKENSLSSAKNGEENSNTFHAAFLKCATSLDNKSKRLRKITECSELFVVFDINKISTYEEFVELKIMPLVAHYLIKGLNLESSLVSMPVKACRRKDSNAVWCHLMANYENTNVTEQVLNFAEKSPLARSKHADIPKIIKVYFSLDDTVDIDNPWGSCPLLHNGTNFRTPEYSRYFHEFTGSSDDCDTAENTCFVYSQKNPTIEIPSKLNTEAEIVMTGVVSDAKYLFEEEEEDEKGKDNKKLMIAMALSHPKSRIRNIGNFYFSAFLPKCTSNCDRTWKCSTTNRISVGRDANLVPPRKETAVDDEDVTVEEKKYDEERKKQEPSIIKNNISRKMYISSYRCLACRGTSNKCCKKSDFYQSPAAAHLSHGSGTKMIDILLCSKNELGKKLAEAILPNFALSKFTMENCDLAAVCHNFFCRGVQPVCTPFSSTVIKKNKLVLYGKVVDVVNTNHSVGVPINRKRIFYTNEELNKNVVPFRSVDAKTAFKDIVYHECDKKQIKLYEQKNNVSASSTNNNKKWWMTMVDLTTDFDRHVEQFYSDLANQDNSSKLFNKNCMTLFSEFYEKCKKYSQAKSKLLNIQKKKKEGNEINEVVNVLTEYHARDDAATSALMHKSMFLGSRTVFSGVRCVVSEENKEFEVRQYVVTMAGSALTKVTDEDLIEYTPVKGAVSVTTAPNDKLPVSAHQTWQDFNNDTDNIKSPTGCNRSLPIDNWRAVKRPSYASFNRRSFSTPSENKYIPPHLRKKMNDSTARTTTSKRAVGSFVISFADEHQ